MEIKRPKIKSMKYEDFNDNEYLEQMEIGRASCRERV